MCQQIKVLVAKYDDPSSMPGTRMVGGRTQLTSLLFSDLHMSSTAYTPPLPPDK